MHASEGQIMTATKFDLVAFSYGGVDVMLDDSYLVSLTQMWEAAGRPANQGPYEWGRGAGASFVEDLARFLNTGKSRIWKSRRGKHLGGTWAHWQIAMAYAKHLSHEFHRFVNEAFRRWTNGETRASCSEPPSSPPASPLVQQARLLLATIERQEEIARIQDEHARRLALAESSNAQVAARTNDLEGDTTEMKREIAQLKAANANLTHMVVGSTGYHTLFVWARSRGVHLSPPSFRRQERICRDISVKLGHEIGRYLRRDSRYTRTYSTTVLELWLEGYLREEERRAPRLFPA